MRLSVSIEVPLWRRPRYLAVKDSVVAGRSSLAKRSERGANLGREEFGLFPGGEVAAFVDLVEVGEAGVGLLDPAARGAEDLAGERGVSDRERGRRRSGSGGACCGLSASQYDRAAEAPVPVSQYSVMLSRMWSLVRLPEGCPSTNARAIL